MCSRLIYANLRKIILFFTFKALNVTHSRVAINLVYNLGRHLVIVGAERHGQQSRIVIQLARCAGWQEEHEDDVCERLVCVAHRCVVAFAIDTLPPHESQ